MDDRNTRSKTVDPIAVDLLLTVLGTVVSIVAALHQFGVFSKRRHELGAEYRNLHDQVLRLQNALDDLILTLQRHQHSGETDLVNRHLTISETMMYLEQRDYVRWLDVQALLRQIDGQIYEIVGRIRRLSFDYLSQGGTEAFDAELTRDADKFILRFGTFTLGQFVTELRAYLGNVEAAIVRLAHNRSDA